MTRQKIAEVIKDNLRPLAIFTIIVMWFVIMIFGMKTSADSAYSYHDKMCAKYHLQSHYYDEVIGKHIYSRHFCFDKKGVVYFLTND